MSLAGATKLAFGISSGLARTKTFRFKIFPFSLPFNSVQEH